MEEKNYQSEQSVTDTNDPNSGVNNNAEGKAAKSPNVLEEENSLYTSATSEMPA